MSVPAARSLATSLPAAPCSARARLPTRSSSCLTAPCSPQWTTDRGGSASPRTLRAVGHAGAKLCKIAPGAARSEVALADVDPAFDLAAGMVLADLDAFLPTLA